MDVLGTVNVDGLAAAGTDDEVTWVKIHRLCLAVWVVALHSLFYEDGSTFETIDQFLLIFLLDLGECLNSLSSLLF